MLRSQCPHACPPAMGHWALQPCLRLLLPAPLQQEAASPGWGRALGTGQLLTQAPALPPLLQELLAILHQEGPTTEGIFQKAESTKARQELRQALDHGLHVDMASQPVLLLAMVLKDFLRSIPGKLLVTDLYEDWMAAMQMASREDEICQVKEGAKKLPAANLLLLRQLLALLRLIGQHVSSSRMTCSSLAICLGPKLLSPPQEEQLELEAMLARNKKVRLASAAGCSLPSQRQLGCPEVPVPGGPLCPAKVAAGAACKSCPQPAPSFCAEARLSRDGRGCLARSWASGLRARLSCVQVNALVDFTLENSGDIFGEQVAGPSESPAPTELCTEMHREEQSGPAGREDDKPQAESDPDASPSLPETRQGDGEEATVLEVQRAEVPPALSPNTHQSSPESLAKAEALTSLSVCHRLASIVPEGMSLLRGAYSFLWDLIEPISWPV
uniref:Uncharacterized protein n=1 Tax=Corvus moneduloides TaxID=1196302 RepID=A0A8U7NUB5_CORMO